jgi:hypothetical protein
MTQEVQDDEYHQASPLDGRGEVTYPRRSPVNWTVGESGVPILSGSSRPVVRLGETSPAGSAGSPAQRPAGSQGTRSQRAAANRDRTAAGGDCRTERRVNIRP